MSTQERRGPVHDFLAADHARLDALLDRATTSASDLDAAPFEEFRGGLLRHIGMEEKVLLPAVRRANGGTPHPLASRLRRDHSAIAMLLVPTPTRAIVEEIVSILAPHNAIEEGADGVYAACDRLPPEDVSLVLKQLRSYPQVKLAPHFDGPGVYRRAEDALRAASVNRASEVDR